MAIKREAIARLRSAQYSLRLHSHCFPVRGTTAISRVPYRGRRAKIAFLNVKI